MTPCPSCLNLMMKFVYVMLAADGMLVKRPLLIGEEFVLTGFKEKEWQEKLQAAGLL